MPSEETISECSTAELSSPDGSEEATGRLAEVPALLEAGRDEETTLAADEEDAGTLTLLEEEELLELLEELLDWGGVLDEEELDSSEDTG